MKKPKSMIECYTLAEGCKSRKKAKKLLKRFDKLQHKQDDLRKIADKDCN